MKRVAAAIIIAIIFVMAVLFTNGAVAQSSELLPETYVSEDESFMLRYPAGWYIESDSFGFVMVATSEDVFDIGDEPMPPGQAVMAIAYLNGLEDEGLQDLFPGDDPVEVLDSIIQSISGSGTDVAIEFTTAHEITFLGDPAARADGLYMDSHIFVIVSGTQEGTFRMALGVTAEADFAKYEPKLLAIAESVNYLPRGE